MFRVDSWPFHKPSIGVPKGVSLAAGVTLDRYTANVRSLQRQIRGSLTGRSHGPTYKVPWLDAKCKEMRSTIMHLRCYRI